MQVVAETQGQKLLFVIDINGKHALTILASMHLSNQSKKRHITQITNITQTEQKYHSNNN